MSFRIKSSGLPVAQYARLVESSNELFNNTYYYKRTSYSIDMNDLIKDSQYLAPGDNLFFLGDLYLDLNSSPIGTVTNQYTVTKIITEGSSNTPTVSQGFIRRCYNITNDPKGNNGQIYLTTLATYTTLFNDNVLVSNSIAPGEDAIIGGSDSYRGIIGSSKDSNYIQQGVTQIIFYAQGLVD